MAVEETPAVTRPARVRGARKTAAPAVKETAAPAETTTAAGGDVRRLVVTLEHVKDTKQYSVFQPPVGSGCVGSLYVPLGATDVRVAITGG